jgi:ketosteroid isomerase-like protein
MNLTRWVTAIAISFAVGAVVLGDVFAAPAAQSLNLVASQQANTINENQIREILEQMKLASSQKDTKAIMQFLAPDAIVQVTVEAMGKSQTMNLTRAQYYQYLQQGFYITDTYNGKYSNLKIQVTPNRKAAIATYVLDEEVTLKKQPGTLVSSSDASMRFEIVKGQILVTNLKSTSRLGIKQ